MSPVRFLVAPHKKQESYSDVTLFFLLAQENKPVTNHSPNPMNFDILNRQLQLIAALAQNRSLTVDEICERLKLNRRSTYRYIDAFRNIGFKIKNKGSIYSLEHTSPFFLKISNRTHFTEDESQTLHQILNSVNDNSAQIRHLRVKLSRLYDFNTLAAHGVDEKAARSISLLYKAMQEERTVILKGYQSHNSSSVSDRIVEPYLFLNGNSEIRCHEISSGTNKTFKINRCDHVEILDLQWEHKDRHKASYTDLFHFSGEERMRIKLRFNNFVRSLLLEDYPAAETQVTQEADGNYLLDTEVCSYKGIGRFVMGLADDIEIVDSPDFSKYLIEKAKNLTIKFGE